MRRLYEAGTRGPLWVRADRQTAGYGRRGRAWQSPAGNLAATLLWPLDAPLGPDGPAGYGFAAALAIRDACVGAGADAGRLSLKWPNDVLLATNGNWAKLSGLLIELLDAQALAIGIGVNLAEGPGAAVPYETAALADACPVPTPPAFLSLLDAAFVRRVEAWRAGGFAVLREAWLDAARGIGVPVTARLPKGEVSGTFQGLSPTGALCIATPEGVREVTAGDVFFPSGPV